MKTAPTRHAFTIVEVIIVIAVIAILATISAVGYRALQADTRDNERKADTELIAAGLERYYDEHGSYPGWRDLAYNASGREDAANVARVLNLPPQAVVNPDSSTKPPKHDIINTSDDPASTAQYVYFPQRSDGSSCANRTDDAPCSRFTLRYKKEAGGSIETVKSRYGW